MAQQFHYYQNMILKKLMYQDAQKFSELQIPNIESKLFTYHLKKLREQKFVEKKDNKYYLTLDGKMYLDRIDEANMDIEKLPKVSVATYPLRVNKDGVTEILLSRRLKHPNYGKVVGIGGKVRFGETFEETAKRELLEETGLRGKFEMTNILRKIAHNSEEEGSKAIMDIVFVLFKVTEVEGELLNEIKDQENFWYELDKVKDRDDISETLPHFIDKALNGKLDPFEQIVEMEGF